MAFWGALVKPGEPYTLHCNGGAPKRLRISQATLGDGNGIWMNRRSVVRCSVGTKPPVYLCSLSLKEMHSCQLDFEFEESQDIIFSVIGPRGVHLAGYYLNSPPQKIDSCGDEDIEETENKHSSRHNSKEDEYHLSDSFIDDSALQIRPILRETSQSGAVAEVFDNGKKMGCEHVKDHMVSSIETSQQQYIIVERKNEAEKYEAIDLSVHIEKQSDGEIIHKDENEDHSHKIDDVMQCRMTEVQVHDFSVPQRKSKQQESRILGEKIQRISTENDKNCSKMDLDLEVDALDSNSRNPYTDTGNASTGDHSKLRKKKTKKSIAKKEKVIVGSTEINMKGRDCQVCSSPMHKLEDGPQDAENMKIKKENRVVEKLVSDNVLSHCHSLPVDCSDGELDGGYVSASWTSDGPLIVPSPSAEHGVRHGGELKKKKKRKVGEFNVIEDNVTNIQNQAISDGRSDIVAMDHYPRHTQMNGIQDDHMDNLLKDNKILSIDAGDALTRSHRKSKKKKTKKYRNLDSEASQREYGQYVFKERKYEVVNDEMSFGSATLEEKSCGKSNDKDDKEDNNDGLYSKGMIDVVQDGNVKRIGSYSCDSAISPTEVGTSDGAEKLFDGTVNEGPEDGHKIIVGVSNERNQMQKEMLVDYDESRINYHSDSLVPPIEFGLGVAKKLKIKKKRTKCVAEMSMVSDTLLNSNQHQVEFGLGVAKKLKKKKKRTKCVAEMSMVSDTLLNSNQNQVVGAKKLKKKKRTKCVAEMSMVSDTLLNSNQNQVVGHRNDETCNANGHLRHVTDFSVIEGKGKLKKKEVEASKIHEKSTQNNNTRKIVLALPAVLESKSK